MKALAGLICAAAVAVLAGCRPPPKEAEQKPATVTYRSALFTAVFPGQPGETKMNSRVGSERTSQSVLSYTAPGGANYTVTATTLPAPSAGFRVGRRLDQARADLKRDLRASAVQQRSIAYRGVPGREFKVVGTSATEWCHTFVVTAGPNPVMYQVSVNDADRKVADADVRAFLASLTFPTK